MKKLIVLFSLLMCLVFSPFALATDPDPLLVADLDQIEAASEEANQKLATQFQVFTENYLGSRLDASAWRKSEAPSVNNTSTGISAGQAASSRNETFILDLFTGSGETVDTTINLSEEEAVESSKEETLDNTNTSSEKPKKSSQKKKETTLVCPTKESLLRWQVPTTEQPSALLHARRNMECLIELSKVVDRKLYVANYDYYPGPPKVFIKDVPQRYYGLQGLWKGKTNCFILQKGICVWYDTSPGTCKRNKDGFLADDNKPCSAGTNFSLDRSALAREVAKAKQLGVYSKYDKVEFTREPSREENERFKKLLRQDINEWKAAAANWKKEDGKWHQKHGPKVQELLNKLEAIYREQ